jgi:hypothetical protein
MSAMKKLFAFAVSFLLLAECSTFAAATMIWKPGHVRASVEKAPLAKVLETISSETGWEIYVQPGTELTVSAKFRDLSETEALKRLLGTLSFSLTPVSNSVRKLYVYQSSIGDATQLVHRPALASKNSRIPNELVVALKPGTSIDELAKRLGAKVVGRNDWLNTYRLQFPDAESADAAYIELADNDDVKGLEYNYAVDAPPVPEAKPVAATALPGFDLKANPDPNHVVVALIDTHVQALDPSMQAFLLPSFNQAGNWTGSPDEPTHGTFMAETILHAVQAQLQGGSSSLRILPIDVYGNSPQSTTFDVGNGTAFAIKNGARIINLSLGSSGDSQFLQQVIAVGSKQGIVFIAAAGNQPTTSLTYPAAYSGVLAVTASDSNGKLASYANRGAFVDVIFPGTDIGKVGTTAYQVSGTSTATAYASGTAAALIQSKALSPSATMTFMSSNYRFSGTR